MFTRLTESYRMALERPLSGIGCSEIAPQRSSRWWLESILAVNTYFGTAQEQQATLPGIEPYETVNRPSFFGTVEGGFGIARTYSAQLYLELAYNGTPLL